MFKSIKLYVKALTIGITILSIVSIMLLVSYIETGKAKIYFEAPVVITIGVLIVVALIFTTIFIKSINFPMKKMQKSMKALSDGKNQGNALLYDSTSYKEFTELFDVYTNMKKVVLKNNFDLNSQESKTEIILERMDDGVIAFSLHRDVIHMNTAAKKDLNLSEQENTYEKVMKKLGLKIDYDKIIYMPEGTKNIEEKVTLSTGIFNVVLVPFYNEKLLPMGAILLAKNITEAEKLNNMRKEFVANVSHELKTPLCSIKGYSETIMDRDLSKEEIIRFASVINAEANRMDRIVADLLQLSRFDYQKNVWNKSQFNLDDLAKQVVENLKYVAKEKNHKLNCIVNMVPPPIYADKDSIQQVITNIVSNSIKYTKEDGEITVYVGAAGGKAYMKFVDNGMGIPEKDLKRIFARFYRVDKARSRAMGGTGLGLSIVKEIVAQHDGTIDIKSEVGVGTEVTVTLPTIK